jgi:hypothetical protein
VTELPFPISYAAIVGVAAILMYLSSTLFVLPGEPERGTPSSQSAGFLKYLQEGIDVFKNDTRFRLFVFAQWAGALNLMAVPFYLLVAVVGPVRGQVSFFTVIYDIVPPSVEVLAIAGG